MKKIIFSNELRPTWCASDFWSAGEILYVSWGYNQTNIDFYQVVEVTNKSLKVRPINQRTIDSRIGSQTCTAIRDEYTGGEVLKRCNADGHIYFKFGCGSKWDGKPVPFTTDA